MPYDLLLTGATVIDPSQNLNGPYDVAITGDQIVALSDSLDGPAKQTLDLTGKILTPGWIDIHAHVYAGATTWGIKADALCLATGVTTLVDAGSPGWANFMGFKEFIADPARTQILTFVHISGIGLTYGPLAEMGDIRYACVERTALVIHHWPEICVGVKVRQGKGQVEDNYTEPLRLGIEAAALVDKPVMVHIGAGVALPDVLALMRPGDIATHCYQGHGDTLIGPTRDGTDVIDAAWQARQRGILFDLGHGGGSFNFDVAKKALAQNFPSDVISTDLHAHSLNDPVYSLPETASKVMHLGVPLADIIRQTTSAPAAAIGRADQLGTLKPGTIADLAAFELQQGQFIFEDVHGQQEHGRQTLQPVLTVRAGSVYRPEELKEEVEEEWRRSQLTKALNGKNFAAFGWTPGN